MQKRFERLAEIELGLGGECFYEFFEREATLLHMRKDLLVPTLNVAWKTRHPDFLALECSAKSFDRPALVWNFSLTGWKHFAKPALVYKGHAHTLPLIGQYSTRGIASRSETRSDSGVASANKSREFREKLAAFVETIRWLHKQHELLAW